LLIPLVQPLVQPLVRVTVKSGELNFMTLALKREQFTYRSLLMLAGAVLADPEPMLSGLVRGFIAITFTACVRRQAVMSG